MIYSTPFNLSMKLYDKYKNILLKNVPEDYQDDISCGFIIRTYSELSKFESGSYPLIQKYNKIDEYYLRTLSEELLSHKVSSYISNDSTRALTHIKNYVLQLEKENKNLQKQVKALTTRNQNLTQENNNLKTYLKGILEAIKHFFREMLQIGNDKTKEATTSEIKNYYDNKDFDSNDVYDISKGTTK